jgi:hypothetical protein
VLTTCQPSTVWCSRERRPAAAAQPAKVRQSCSATDLFVYLFYEEKFSSRYGTKETEFIYIPARSIMLLLLLFMSMVSDNVSELRPPTVVFLIFQVIYEYGESWWNDTGRGKLNNSE